MYFANMYCYGRADDIAGITGIRGCLGIIYVGAAAMYALHIPDNGPDANKAAGKVFVKWVKNQGEAVGKGHGYLFAYANGRNRSLKGYYTAEEQATDIKKGLGSPPTILYRIMRHLGPGSGGMQADSVAIMLERVHASKSNPTGCISWYKQNDPITWISGGTNEAGQYKMDPRYQGDKVPSDLEAHWWLASDVNCTLTTI
jgi:hypothetical protein